MKYTIEKMQDPLVVLVDKSEVTYEGYAFMDETGHCIIVVYGEKHKKDMISYLNNLLF